jgi:hypothetical protein
MLFYTNGRTEKPDQLIREPGVYEFKLMLDEALVEDFGPLDRIARRKPVELRSA